MKFIRFFVLPAIILAAVLGGCSRIDEPDYREQEYGYVQFKLYKEVSYPGSKAVMPQLEYLHDATKIKVTLRYGEDLIVQTLVLNAYNETNAEYGMRSEKLKVLAGQYQVVNYALYDKLDELVYEGTPGSDSVFEVVPGGMYVHDLLAKVRARGWTRFTLIKDFSDFEETPKVKSTTREYSFDEIKTVSITVKSEDTGKETTFSHLETEFEIHFDESDDVEDGYQTATIVCDTLLSLEAGNYVIKSYQTYADKKALIETNTLSKKCAFEVVDNATAEVNVPVALNESAPYIQDYYALYEIWKALHGEDWYYVGENYDKGTNWNFNKDCDLWGDQPGVQIHSNGRVALIDISDFGFYGEMPECLGQLTELIELYLGTHNDLNVYTYNSSQYSPQSGVSRKQKAIEYLHRTHPAEQFSEPIARAMAEKGVKIREIEMYDSLSESEIIDRQTGKMRVRPMDTNPGTIVNGLTRLPESMANLKSLEKLCIANSELAELPDAFSRLVACTDLELYNLPNMKTFPEVISRMPALVLANLSCNPQWAEPAKDYTRHDGGAATESDKGLDLLATGPAKSTIQMIYMNNCGLTEVSANMKNLKSLGLLSLSNNKIDRIYPLGGDIVMVQMYLDHNRLTEVPVDENGVFCGMDDVENISFSNNLLTELPDIFTAKSKYIMKSIDFSSNLITKVQNGENYKGINVETLSLTNNPITVYPVEFAKSKSKVAYVNLRCCNLNEIPEEAFEGEYVNYLMSLDLSYNHLNDLPKTFNATNMPYFYGLEISYNEFSEFPYEPLDCYGLTVFGIRGQRNKAGERCLSEWPTGIYQHVGLRGFYIGSNDLGKINDTISPICYYLEISDNPNIIFDASNVCYEYSIGAYYLIYDKTQDIRGCDIMKL